jgi:16S rRNA (adenine1518-N6/adenine1519-N6)-dimethyltransferase
VVRAKRSLGQNFLIDPNLQRKIAAAINPRAADVVIEIGPGRGALTRHLAGSVKRLITIEKDDALAAALQEEFRNTPVSVLHADALLTNFAELAQGEAFKVIGNIPYNITTPLLFHALDPPNRPELMVVMVQREVADRILAAPGDRNYGALSVVVRIVATAERLFHVPRAAFRPQPGVDSTVIRIVPHQPPRLLPSDEADVRTLTRTAFAWRRKQLQKILRAAPSYGLSDVVATELLRGMNIDPQQRPEVLSPEQFVHLASTLRQRGLPRNHDRGSIQG